LHHKTDDQKLDEVREQVKLLKKQLRSMRNGRRRRGRLYVGLRR
jgi:hypothetical protein